VWSIFVSDSDRKKLQQLDNTPQREALRFILSTKYPIITERTRWVRHVARILAMRIIHRILVVKHEKPLLI
jgi:hypothetical protein